MFKRNLPWPTVSFWFDSTEYQWSGWFGSQLESYEWFRVPAGTTRTLKFSHINQTIDIRVFTTKREGLKIRTTWSIQQIGSCSEYYEKIKALQNILQSLV